MQFQQLTEFVSNHWVLFLALAAILALLAHNLVMGGKGSVDPFVVDVRSAADFAKGHIINAVNIPMNGFKNQMATLQKHKNKPILINCRSGSQSSAACQHLRKEGFEEVYNLQGGILAWQSANLPLTRKKR